MSVPAAVTLCLVLVAAARAQMPKPATADDINDMIAAAGDKDDYPGASELYILDEADVYVQESGLATTESCQVIKMLTPAAVRKHARIVNGFDPATNRVAVHAVRIHRADGGVEEVNVGDEATQPAPQNWIYWGNRQHVIDLPRLEVNDVLELHTSKIGFNIAYLLDEGGRKFTRAVKAAGVAGPVGENGEDLQPPMPGEWYEVTLFQARHPIAKKRYSVHMPKDMPVQYEVYNGKLHNSLWFNKDNLVYTFWDENIPAVKSEPHMLALDDFAPKVVMATLEDWESKSRWFYKVNEGQFAADEAVRKKVYELTKNLDTEKEKITACLHWVADNVRYYGTSRGPCEGFTLHKGNETFRDRGGVCKDKAGMLITMMRVLGEEVYPALTMAGSRVEAIPADQFNHTVTVMRNKDKTFTILDPTWSPLSREWWSTREAEQYLVYGTPEGQGLVTSPYFSPEDNSVYVRAASYINNAGDLRTGLAMQMKGYPCTYLRRNAERYAEPDQMDELRAQLNFAPNAELTFIDFTDPYDYSQDSVLDAQVRAAHYAAGNSNMRVFRLPALSHPLEGWLFPDFNYPIKLDKRKYGMRMRATRKLQYEETVQLPEGFVVTEVPDDVSLDTDIASMEFKSMTSPGELTYRFVFELKQQIIPAESYPDYKKAIEKMRDLSQSLIVAEAL